MIFKDVGKLKNYSLEVTVIHIFIWFIYKENMKYWKFIGERGDFGVEFLEWENSVNVEWERSYKN